MLNRKKILIVSMIILAILMINVVSATEENTTIETLTTDEVAEDSIQSTLNEVETIESTVSDDEIIMENYDEILSDKISDVEINVTLPENMKAGETYTIDVKMSNDPSNWVEVFYDENSFVDEVYVYEGIGQFEFTPTEFGSHTLRLDYGGNSVYESTSVLIPFEINDYILDFEYHDYDYNNLMYLTVPNSFTGSVNITVNGKEYVLNQNNDYSFIPENVSLGVNEATIHYDGDDTFHVYDSTVSFNIWGFVYYISISNYDYQEKLYYGDKVYLDVPSTTTGKLVLYDDETEVTSCDIVNGYAEIVLPIFFGYNNKLHANYEGDFEDLIRNFNFACSYYPMIDVPSFQMYGSTSEIYIDEEDIGGNLTAYFVKNDDEGNDVFDEIGNVALENGKASITVPSLDAGEYIICVTYVNGDFSYGWDHDLIVGNVSMSLDIINGSNYTRLDYFSIIFENPVSGNLSILFDDEVEDDYWMDLGNEERVYLNMLSEGSHNVSVTFTSPNNQKFTQNAIFNIVIPEFDMKLSVGNGSVHEYLDVVDVYFTDFVSGVSSFYIDGEQIDSYDVVNECSLEYYIGYPTLGIHNLKVVFIDENEVEHSKEVTFKRVPSISIPNLIFPNDDSLFIYMGKYDFLTGNLTAYI